MGRARGKPAGQSSTQWQADLNFDPSVGAGWRWRQLNSGGALLKKTGTSQVDLEIGIRPTDVSWIGSSTTITLTHRVASRNFVTGCLTWDVTRSRDRGCAVFLGRFRGHVRKLTAGSGQAVRFSRVTFFMRQRRRLVTFSVRQCGGIGAPPGLRGPRQQQFWVVSSGQGSSAAGLRAGGSSRSLGSGGRPFCWPGRSTPTRNPFADCHLPGLSWPSLTHRFGVTGACPDGRPSVSCLR